MFGQLRVSRHPLLLLFGGASVHLFPAFGHGPIQSVDDVVRLAGLVVGGIEFGL